MKRFAIIGCLVVGLIAIYSALDAKPGYRSEAAVATAAEPDSGVALHSPIFSTYYIAEATQEVIAVQVYPLSEGTVSDGFVRIDFKPPVLSKTA